MTAIVSVIIPHLNQPEDLKRCLESLQSQSVERSSFEIIVVDNGSKILPQDVCVKFGAQLLQEKEPGPGPARNKGVAAAEAEWLAFIDADCVADPHWLEAAIAELSKPGTAVVGGDVRIAYADLHKLTALEAYESVFAYRQKEYIERKGFSGTGNLAMTKDVFREVGPFANINLAEDRDWGNRATAQGHNIRFVSSMIIFHPARKTFAELQAKWRRHILHDFSNVGAGWRGSMIWIAKAVAVVGSLVRDIPMIFASDRLGSFADRIKAVPILVQIRFWRSFEMLHVLLTQREARSPRWNLQ